MIISLLLSGFPTALTLVGGLIAAAFGLHLVVAVAGTKRPHDRAAVGLALGLSMIAAMALRNPILEAGFEMMSIDESAALLVQEGGNPFDDLILSGQVIIILLIAIALGTILLATAIGVIVRIFTARSPTPPPRTEDAVNPV